MLKIWRKQIAAALVAAGMIAGTTNAQSLPGWTLVWADEFSQPDGSLPSLTNWSYNLGTGNSGWGNNELQFYTARTNNARIEGGQLVIEAHSESYSNRNYTSARLITRDRWTWTYGRFEARIKMPRGKGIWPAFWALGRDVDTTGWPGCGEIDIMENRGGFPSVLHGTLHGPGYSGDNGVTATLTLPGGAAYADDYHVYAVEWETNRIRWFMDGKLFHTASPATLPAGGDWVFTKPHYLLLNVAVGGNWPGSPDATTVFPQRMFVDYVRVYAASNQPTTAAASPTVAADVVVFGGTSGGVIAAVQAARLGKSVVLVEPGRHVGGMTSGGLSLTDFGNINTVGGMSLEFYKRVGAKYGFTNPHWASPVGSNYKWYFDPSVAETVFTEMLAEARVPVYFGQQLVSATKENGRLTHITTGTGLKFRAKMFMDTTYEGDLMAAAGVSYTVGRESREQYGESLAGVVNIGNGGYNFDPYVVPGNPASGVLPLVSPTASTNLGAGGPEVQSYNFRLCITQNPTNMIPLHLAPPPNYSEARYELMGRYIQARVVRHGSVSLGDLLTINGITPNGKVDVNNGPGGVSTDFVGESKTWATNTYAGREVVRQAHEDYIRGLLYYLGNGAAVPANVRNEMRSWGLAKDEFTDNNGWPHQLYVREARRMVGDYVIQQQNSLSQRIAGDSIALASYSIDSHATQRFPLNGLTYREGGMYSALPRPFPIGYRSIVPRVGECENLFVTFALSASHVAFGACRMEPVFMMTSQSAATAAAFAIDDKVSVQQVNYPKLALQLTTDGQVLAWDWGIVSTNASTNSIVVDNTDAGVVKVGAWSTSTETAKAWGTSYLHDSNTGGGKSVTFSITIPTNGLYEVNVWWPAHANRATNAAFDITHDGGTTRVRADQTKNGAVWVRLLMTNFTAGSTATVTITNDNASGYVVADAVRFAPVQLGDPAPPPPSAMVVDNADPVVTKVGSWTSSASTSGFWATNYMHDGASGLTNAKSARFPFTFTESGVYHVEAWWPALANRASNAAFDITHPGGTTRVIANQRTNGSQWVRLLTTNFVAGAPAVVTLTNHNANGYVIADAVRLAPVNLAAVLPEVHLFASDSVADELQTNTARLTVIRSGDVTLPLAVSYIVEGTAESGADYSALPGVLAMNPGVAATNLSVTPLPDAEREDAETVIVTLSGGADHVVGDYGSAIVTLLDTPPVERPFFNIIQPQADGWQMSFTGNPAAFHEVQRATNLAGPWTVLGGALTAGSGSAAWVDTSPPLAQAFYRLRTP